MKVIFNTSNFPKWKGEATTPFIFHLAEALVKTKVKVTVLAPHAPGAKKHEEWNGVKIKRFQYAYPSKLEQLFVEGGAIANLRKNKFKYLLIPPFFLAQLISLFFLTLKEKPNLIHSHWIIPQGVSGIIVAKLFRIPHIITLHGGDIFLFNWPILRKIKRVVAESSDWIIFNSPFSKNEFRKITGYDKKNNAVIPAPVKLEEFCKNISRKKASILLKKYGINPQKKIILFVGRIVDEKGIGTLIKAYSLLPPKIKGLTQLVIVGEGKDRKKFENLAKELGIYKNTIFTGWIDHSKLKFFYRFSQVFVGISQTSKEGCKEGMGITFIEALASSCPIIVSEEAGFLSWFDQTVPEEINLLTKPYTPEKLSKFIQKAVKIRKRRKASKEIGSFLSIFDSKNVADEHFLLYQKAIHA